MKVIPINKVIREIEEFYIMLSTMSNSADELKALGYNLALNRCISIIKNNIKEVNGKVYKSK